MVAPRRIVGKAQVDQVHRLGGQVGNEAIFRGAVQIDNALVAAVPERSTAAGHHIGVQVDRIDRVGDGNANIGGKDFLNVAGVAFGPVADENFIGVDVRATGP